MKRYLFLLLVVFFQTTINAKTTYIPTYYTQININGCDVQVADSAIRRDLIMYASDGRYSITVLHDSITQERVKNIKRTKRAAGWAVASAILSGASATLNPMRTSWDAVNYMNSMDMIKSSTMLSVAAMQTANNLQRLSVSIIIENYSDKEMVVNDMNRGLTWYVPAHNYICLNVGNPEVNKLRIAYSNCQDQKIDYLTVQAANYLDKETIYYEDDEMWIVPVYVEEKVLYGDNNDEFYMDKKFSHYSCVNKTTFDRNDITEDELKQLKKKK